MAFEKFVKNNKKSIQGIIRNFVDSETSKDIEQEVYLKMWKTSSHEKPFGYIKTLVVNTCKDFLKSKNYKNSKITLSESDEMLSIKDNKDTPQQKTENIFRKRTIYNAINSLPPKLKEIIILYDIEELSQGEIAHKLNCPIGTVKSRLFKARKLLQNELKEFI
jgi:RNA polymerase sigma-70 factor (ECF subfamily)